MTKTTEQREKDLTDGVTWVVVTAWEKAISGFEKDLKAPIFMKSGNIAAFAAQYDKLQSTFNKQMDKKKSAIDGFDNAGDQLDKIGKEKGDLKKELEDVITDADASLKFADSPTPDRAITDWENAFKDHQDVSKEEKGIFDRWTKLSANEDKLYSDAIGKAKKELASANSELKASNDQLNALEKRMRDAVVAYSNTATSMNRQDIASAVRGFLAIFAKA